MLTAQTQPGRPWDLRVRSAGRLRSGRRAFRARLATVVTASVAAMKPSENRMPMCGSGTDPMCSTCDALEGLDHQLGADEPEDHRQPDVEVDDALQQPADQEVQLAQAHQRERVRGEDDVGVGRQPEDRGDRVQREDDVGHADRDDDEHQRGEHAASSRTA